MNIETLIPDTPDQGLYYKKGQLGVPDLLFCDFNGTIIHRTFWSQVNEKSFEKDLAVAEWKFQIYFDFEKDPKDPVAWSSAVLLDLLVDRKVAPIEDLERAAAQEGVRAELVDNYRIYLARKPILDLVTVFNASFSVKDRDECSRKMLELYQRRIRMDDVNDRLFIPFWKMSFEAALAQKDRSVALQVVEDFEKFSASRRIVGVIARTMREDLDALQGPD